MPDITMCSGKGCNLKKNCYRFTAKSDGYCQAYFIEVPKLIKDETCEYMIKNTDYFRNVATEEEVHENFLKILESNSKIYGEGYCVSPETEGGSL